jgi:hypothetical protein
VVHYAVIHLFEKDQFAAYLATFVARNARLDHFGILRRDAVGTLVLGLQHSCPLRVVSFSCRACEELHRQYSAVRVDEQASGEIVSMLLDCNTLLEEIEGFQNESGENETQIEYHLELKRHGKEFCSNI